MSKKAAPARLELVPHLSVPVLLLALLSLPWFFGGRESFGALVVAGLVGLLLLGWLLISRHRALRIDLRPRLILLPLVAGLAWLGLSVLWSVSQYLSLLALVGAFELAVILVVARDVLHDGASSHFFTRLWIASAIVVWGIGAGLLVVGNYDRMTSLFYWANPLASYFLVSLTLSLYELAAAPPKTRASRTWLIISGLFTSGLLLTYSRAAWLVALLGCAALLWSAGKQRRQTALRLGKTLLIGVGLALLVLGVRHFAFKRPTIDVASRVTTTTQSSSVHDRLSYWREASVMFSLKPTTGWGAGTYAEVHPAYQTSPVTAGDNPHSSLWQTFVELGAVGAIIYIVVLGAWLSYGWRLHRGLIAGAKDLQKYAWLAVTLLWLHSLVDLVTNYPVLLITAVVWLAVALPRPVREFRLKAVVPAVGFGLTAAAMVAALGLSWNVYLSNVDAQTVAAVGTADFTLTSDTYHRIFSRPVYDPDLLSAAAVSYVDAYDGSTDQSTDWLNPALKYAKQATEAEPQDARHAFALANVLERQGKVTEALAQYRRSIQLDPHDNPQYQVAYAQLLQREGYVNEAEQVLKTILFEYSPQVIANRSMVNLPPRLAVAQALLAAISVQKGDYIQAKAAMARALELDSSSLYVQQTQAKLPLDTK